MNLAPLSFYMRRLPRLSIEHLKASEGTRRQLETTEGNWALLYKTSGTNLGRSKPCVT